MARAASASPGVPPTKSGIAIGTGWTLPCVTSRRSCARADIEANAPTEAAAPSASARRRVRMNGERTQSVVIAVRASFGTWRSISAAEHVARIEIDDHILPGFVFRDRKERIGRAAAHCTQRALGRDLERRMAAAVHQARLGLQAAVLLELDAHRDDEV